ncbi:MAG: hypothetical protein NVS4B8_20940 [Herpetosiphon sp.]
MMYKAGDNSACAEMIALVAREEDADGIDAAVAAHLGSCIACATAEARLERVIAQYRLAEPPLTDDIEKRLLAFLCQH